MDISAQVEMVLHELLEVMPLNNKHILVMGVSTSEVLGDRIGTNGSKEVAGAIFHAVDKMQKVYGFHVAYQGCEHINRALCVEERTLEQFGLTEVTVVPVKKAGGSMASYAYRHLNKPKMVEFIQADAGIDIGDTLIGMHLKPVAVPIRASISTIGKAHLTMAKTRPKLIGGIRARYNLEDEE